MENRKELERWLQEQTSISSVTFLRLRGLLPAHWSSGTPLPRPANPEPRELVDGRLYKLREVAGATGISVASLRRACLSGQLPFVRANKGATTPMRIRGRDLTTWLTKAERENRRVLSTREVTELKRRTM